MKTLVSILVLAIALLAIPQLLRGTDPIDKDLVLAAVRDKLKHVTPFSGETVVRFQPAQITESSSVAAVDGRGVASRRDMFLDATPVTEQTQFQYSGSVKVLCRSTILNCYEADGIMVTGNTFLWPKI